MIYVGKAAKYLRQKLGITQREAAAVLQISFVHLSNLENDKAAPTRKVLERFRDIWGVDLYVLSWCMQGDANKLPAQFREVAKKLTVEWKRQIDRLVSKREGPTCCS